MCIFFCIYWNNNPIAVYIAAVGFVEVEVVGVVWTMDVGELVVDGSVDGFNVDVDIVRVVNSVVVLVATVVTLGFVEVEVVGLVWTVDVGELVVDGSVDGFNVDVDVVGVVNSAVVSVAADFLMIHVIKRFES